MWGPFKATRKLVAGLLLDKVVAEKEIETPFGTDLLHCQVRRPRKGGPDYLVLKTRGGDATIFVPLERKGATELVGFVRSSFLDAEA
ncbi:MAG TPA: hypothetical protein VGN97_23825 [Mesorhizobium sp.]|jgi:hypothetical protein|nr:hypothetical protein [Mesorhizobium sp.]